MGLFLAVAIFAADKRPDVTVISAKKYEIVIDGRSYMSNSKVLNIDNLRNGFHSIRVYEMNPFFSVHKRKQLVASERFMLKNKDVQITIDRFGHLRIQEEKFGNGHDNRKDKKGWDDHNDRKDRNRKF